MREYKLKRWTLPKYYAGKHWPNWYVGLDQHRDSDCLDKSNFEVFLREVRKTSAGLSINEPDMCNIYTPGKGWGYRPMEIDSVFVVRESSDLVGWVEWIAIHESDTPALECAQKLLGDLDTYPVLDEDHLTNLEDDEIQEYWQNMPLRYRVDLCKEHGDNIFAARHNFPPERCYDYLKDTWK